MHKYDLSIVVPFYNEEGNVSDVVKGLEGELSRNKIGYELILVNNGSSDSTPKIIGNLKKRNSRIRQVNIRKNEGYGWGIISGLDVAKGKCVGYVDGDNQVHPKYIVNAYNKISATDAAICLTRRLSRNEGFARKIASIAYNLIVSVLFFIKVSDINSKPKIIRQKFYKDMRPSAKGWFIDTEIVLKAKNKGFRFVEVPLTYTNRKKGKSKVNFGITKELLFDIIRYRLSSTSK
ncbi:glycosyltransferase family 2 protein [Candidatus Woesearchaeota archaeon]|nr:glycosyltransferase family 2 protein [Candidatus Woesearchaeota archaeon]